MNDQELGNIIDKCSRNAIKSYIKHNYTFNKLIKQDQALREIDARIEEIKYLSRGDVEYIDINDREIEERIAVLQAQKDKLIKGVE